MKGIVSLLLLVTLLGSWNKYIIPDKVILGRDITHYACRHQVAKTKWKKNIGAKEIEKEGKCIYTTGESEGWGDWEGLSCNQRQHLLYKETTFYTSAFHYTSHLYSSKVQCKYRRWNEVKIRFLVAKIVLFFKLTFSYVMSYFCGAQEVCFELKKNTKKKKESSIRQAFLWSIIKKAYWKIINNALLAHNSMIKESQRIS